MINEVSTIKNNTLYFKKVVCQNNSKLCLKQVFKNDLQIQKKNNDDAYLILTKKKLSNAFLVKCSMVL